MNQIKLHLIWLVFFYHASTAQTNDAFSNASTISHWSIHQTGPNAENYYETLEINGNLILGNPVGGPSGQLTLIPGPEHVVWYNNEMGPMLSQEISGNFVVSTFVKIRSKNDLNALPQSDFNAAGLIARNPSTTGNENYVVVNLGMQSIQNGVGVETKTTINGISTFFLTPDSSAGELRICRIGNTFRLYKKTTDDNLVLMKTFERPDLPASLQVGIMANGYDPGNTVPPDLRAEFDYVYFGKPESVADCTDILLSAQKTWQNASALNFYPNPFREKLFVEVNLEQNADAHFTLFDLHGNVVEDVEDLEAKEPGGARYFELNASEIPVGIYFVRLSTDKYASVRKVVKIK